MKKVNGIGGIFFKSDDAPALRDWYRNHLGIPVDDSYGGASFEWREPTEGISDIPRLPLFGEYGMRR